MVSAIDFVTTNKDFLTNNIFMNFTTNEEYKLVLSLRNFLNCKRYIALNGRKAVNF